MGGQELEGSLRRRKGAVSRRARVRGHVHDFDFVRHEDIQEGEEAR